MTFLRESAFGKLCYQKNFAIYLVVGRAYHLLGGYFKFLRCYAQLFICGRISFMFDLNRLSLGLQRRKRQKFFPIFKGRGLGLNFKLFQI